MKKKKSERRQYFKNGIDAVKMKKILKEKGVTQSAFADMAGVTQANTNFNLNKKMVSNIDLIVAASKISGLTINELITGKKPEEVQELTKRLLEYERELNLLRDIVELQKEKLKRLAKPNTQEDV